MSIPVRTIIIILFTFMFFLSPQIGAVAVARLPGGMALNHKNNTFKRI